MGPSGPMHSPEGTLAIIPIVLKNIVSKDVKDVILPVKLKKLTLKWKKVKKVEFDNSVIVW